MDHGSARSTSCSSNGSSMPPSTSGESMVDSTNSDFIHTGTATFADDDEQATYRQAPPSPTPEDGVSHPTAINDIRAVLSYRQRPSNINAGMSDDEPLSGSATRDTPAKPALPARPTQLMVCLSHFLQQPPSLLSDTHRRQWPRSIHSPSPLRAGGRPLKRPIRASPARLAPLPIGASEAQSLLGNLVLAFFPTSPPSNQQQT